MCLVILICCVVDQSCSPVIQYNYYTSKVLTVDYTIHVDTCMRATPFYTDDNV